MFLIINKKKNIKKNRFLKTTSILEPDVLIFNCTIFLTHL